MRVRRGMALATAAALSTLSAGALLVACFDLLHSTSGVLTACELDAGHPGCAPDAGQDGETDFCAWDPDEAKQHALHACSWLGACETPLGNNAFGPCVFRALLAYDCAANPNHHAHHTAHTLWDCLQRVKSCGEVDSCLFGDAGPPVCGNAGDSAFCGSPASAPDVRVHCTGDGPPPYSQAHGENCALWGQTCSSYGGGTTAICTGQELGQDCAEECEKNGTTLHWCVSASDGGPGIDRGIDCTSNGAAACGGYPTAATAHWVACQPENAAEPCTPDTAVTCADGRAITCPTGFLETLDCKTLLGATNGVAGSGGPTGAEAIDADAGAPDTGVESTDAATGSEDDAPDEAGDAEAGSGGSGSADAGPASACSGGALSPPFDWTSPCVLSPPQCVSDSCSGGTLSSCERGATFSHDCAAEGLGPCRLLTDEPGAMPRAACTPPAP